MNGETAAILICGGFSFCFGMVFAYMVHYN